MENTIVNKIIDLAKEAELCNEPNSAIVLFALAGSIKGEMDYRLAGKVQEFVKDVMMPNIEAKIAIGRISDN